MKKLDFFKVFSAATIAVLLSVGFCFAGWQDERKTIFEINDINDFMEFQRLLRKEDFTFEGKEIHLKTDIIVFDTTDSDTWSQKIKPRDFEKRKHFFENNILDRSITVFRGKFDGNGHYIRGLYGRPLFGNIENAVIQNLNISHSHFLNASIAINSRNSIIKNCNVHANVSANNRNSFAAASYNILFTLPIAPYYLYETPFGIVYNKRNGYNVGALVSKSTATTIKNNSFNGNINGGRSTTGGIVGIAKNSTKLDSNNVSGIIIGKAGRIDEIAIYMSPSSVAIGNNVSSEIIEKSRFTSGYETGYSFGMGEYGINTFDNNIYWGVMINRHFSFSLGTGFQKTTVKRTNGIKYSEDRVYKVFEKVIENEKGLPKDDMLYNGSWISLPIFLKPRYYLSEKSISPFIDADVGIMLCWDKVYYGYSRGVPIDEIEYDFYPSFYFSPSVGVQMRIFTVSLGLKMWTTRYEKLLIGTDNLNLDNFIDTYERGGIVKKPNGAISLKIGVSL